MASEKRCDCGAEATRLALVSTIPGSGDGKLVEIPLCAGCYELEGWAESDLSPGRDMWELALGDPA